jgi:D-inositol-3-phosphate glycosyltransferase
MKPLVRRVDTLAPTTGRRLRIALISEHASPLAALGGADSGGQNVYVAQVARQLGRLGHHVDVFTRRDGEDLPEVVDLEGGVRVIHVVAGPPRPVRKEQLLPLMAEFTAFVERYAARERYDLAHANFFMSGLVAADLKLRLGLPFAITFHALGKVRRQHQGEADGFPDARFEIEERVAREADLILAACPQDEADLINLYRAPRANLVMIPCGFDPAKFWPMDRAQAREALGLAQDEKIVLQLGRMVPRKGVDNLVRALARLVRSGRLKQAPLRLLIVGGESRDPDPTLTPEIGRLQDLARAEGIEDHVTFVGSRGRNELRQFYAASDVFVTTPWYEPFGITPLEAMACGTPVIGANVGGIAYTVVHGETGYLVPAKDPDALAEKIAFVLDQPALARHLGQLAVRRVHAHFTWEKVVARLVEAFETAVDRAPDLQAVRALARGTVDRAFERLLATLTRSRTTLRDGIVHAADLIGATFERGGKVLICGNGGSAADAQHFAAELVGRFLKPGRAGLPVIALTADTVVLTAWANDVGYADVFARQVEALGRPGDLLIAISTSGKSPNVLAALRAAGERGLGTLALLGGTGGDARPLADAALVVPSSDTAQIQELHTFALHTICELVEARESVTREGLANAASRPIITTAARANTH